MYFVIRILNPIYNLLAYRDEYKMLYLFWMKNMIDKMKGVAKKASQKFPILEKIWTRPEFWLILSLCLSIKFLFIRCYKSTDYEVHKKYNLNRTDFYFTFSYF